MSDLLGAFVAVGHRPHLGSAFSRSAISVTYCVTAAVTSIAIVIQLLSQEWRNDNARFFLRKNILMA